MAYEIPVLALSVEADADLSADQYKIVDIASDQQVSVLATTSTLMALGVLQNKPNAAGKVAEVMVMGVTKMIAGETIAAGELVCPSSITAGRVDDADTSTDRILGKCLVGGLVGEYITVLLANGHAQVV